MNIISEIKPKKEARLGHTASLNQASGKPPLPYIWNTDPVLETYTEQKTNWTQWEKTRFNCLFGVSVSVFQEMTDH